MALGKVKEDVFKDPIVYKYLVDFFRAESHDRDESVTRSEINDRLVPLFKNVTLSQINTDWVIRLEEDDTFLGGKSLFVRFIGFLIKMNNWENSRLYRLVECRCRFYVTVNKDDFRKLLKLDIYEQFKDIYDLSNTKHVQLLLVESAETKSNELNNFFNDYINSFKLLNKYTANTKLGRVHHINSIIKRFFAKIDVYNINKNNIIDFVKSNKVPNLNIATFTDLLVQLSKKGFIKDFVMNNLFKEIDRTYSAGLGTLGPDKLIHYLMNFQSYSVIHNQQGKFNTKDVFLLNIKNPHIRKNLIEFIETKQVTIGPLRDFINGFDKSLQGKALDCLSDLNYDTFLTQVNYYKISHDNYLSLTYLVEFYRYLVSKGEPVLNELTNKRFINRTSLGGELYRDCSIVFYQPIESIPESDKWILSYTEDQCTNDGINTTMTMWLDFTVVRNEPLRYALKHYMWYYPGNINVKYGNYKHVIHFLNFISDYSNEKIITFNLEKTEATDITLSKLASYRGTILSKYDKNNTILGHIYATREFLNHIDEYGLLNIEKGYEYYLYYSRNTTYSDSLPIKNGHLKLILEAIKENAGRSNLNSLYMIIFSLLLTTELRPSNIVTLRKDCVEKLSDNKFIINTETKTSNKETVQVPISFETKKQLDEVIRLTESDRLKCHDNNIKKYLFITERESVGTYGVIMLKQFNDYLKNVCSELNLPGYTASNLRDTHMTKAEQFIIEKNYSDIQQNVITGHKSTSLTERHYIKTDINEAINIANNIVIGQENVNSEKEGPSIVTGAYSYNKVLIDENFVTTPDNLLYFENELERIDTEIDNCKSIEKINELINYQALIQGYIKEINFINNQEE